MTDLAALAVTDPHGGPRLSFTVNEAAALLGVSRQTVNRMAAAGRLHAIDTGTSVRLIAAWSLRDLIANHSPDDIPGSPTSPRAIGAGVAAAGDPVPSPREAPGGTT